VPVKGSFALNCENPDQFRMIQKFFETHNDFVRFKDIPSIGERKYNTLARIPKVLIPLVSKLQISIGDDTIEKRVKFFIKYESLNELLKLREVFNARGNKFDMYLIKKRGYDMFTPEFFEKCADKTIYKVIT